MTTRLDGGGPAAPSSRADEPPRPVGATEPLDSARDPAGTDGPGGAAACGWALLEHWQRWAQEPLTAEQRLIRALWSLAAHGERLVLARTFLRAFGGREER